MSYVIFNGKTNECNTTQCHFLRMKDLWHISLIDIRPPTPTKMTPFHYDSYCF